jgi:hypothetical protein
LDEEFVRAAAVTEASHRDRRRLARQARWQARRARVMAPTRWVGERLSGLPRRSVIAVVVLVAAGGAFTLIARRGPADDAASGLPQDTAPQVSPFAGTPAAAFADGEAGVVTPAASATGVFTEDEVAAALRHVRRLVVTANLDPDVHTGSDAEHVARLVGPRTAARLRTAVSRPTAALTASEFLTRFPAGTELVGPVVKVGGAMAVTGADGDRLQIAAEHVFVYPLAPTDLVVVRRSQVWEFERTNGGIGLPELAGGRGTFSTGQCVENDLGYIWPPSAAAPGYDRVTTIATPNLWDVGAPLPAQQGCPA